MLVFSYAVQNELVRGFRGIAQKIEIIKIILNFNQTLKITKNRRIKVRIIIFVLKKGEEIRNFKGKKRRMKVSLT